MNSLANELIPVIAVVGPTASGKSALAVTLAKHLGSEVVSADSMQIYRDMQIGTARPTEKEMDGVVHHMIGFLPLSQKYSVADYVEQAGRCISDIYSRRGVPPVLCGGTGLYVRSLLENIQFSEDSSDPVIRQELLQRYEEEGIAGLSGELMRIDPESAERIEGENPSRIIRALEIYHTTGRTMSEHLKQSRSVRSPYRSLLIGLNYRNRDLLYQRINDRVDRMFRDGLLEEAQRILASESGETAMQAIGYKELKPYFDGACSLEEASDRIKQGTRRYAKRQLTWFRKDRDICWFFLDNGIQNVCGEIIQKVQEFIEKGEVTDE